MVWLSHNRLAVACANTNYVFVLAKDREGKWQPREKLNLAFTQSLRDPDNEQKLANLGFSPIANSRQEADAQWHALVQQWTDVIDKADIKVEQ